MSLYVDHKYEDDFYRYAYEICILYQKCSHFQGDIKLIIGALSRLERSKKMLIIVKILLRQSDQNLSDQEIEKFFLYERHDLTTYDVIKKYLAETEETTEIVKMNNSEKVFVKMEVRNLFFDLGKKYKDVEKNENAEKFFIKYLLKMDKIHDGDKIKVANMKEAFGKWAKMNDFGIEYSNQTGKRLRLLLTDADELPKLNGAERYYPIDFKKIQWIINNDDLNRSPPIEINQTKLDMTI